MSKENMTPTAETNTTETNTTDTNAPPTPAPKATPVNAASLLVESRTVLSKGAKSMTASVNAALTAKYGANVEATVDMKRTARAEIKVRLADKLAPETLDGVTLHRDGKGGYIVCHEIDTVHGARFLVGTMRLADRVSLAASIYSRILKLIGR